MFIEDITYHNIIVGVFKDLRDKTYRNIAVGVFKARLEILPDKYKPNEEDQSNNNIIVTIFKGEPITWESFVMHNLQQCCCRYFRPSSR